MRHILATLLALCLGPAAQAHGVTAGAIEIIHPNIPQPPKGARSAAGYMAIANDAPEADRLIAIESPISAQATLHTTQFSPEGIARMIHLPAIEIPARDTIVLEPGGLHVMFMGLTAGVTEGQMLPATLVFEKAGRVGIEFMVDPTDGVDHSSMNHATMGQAAATAPAPGADDTPIRALLLAQLDRPDAPLTVAPITVQGDIAVAGWRAGDSGGRAFLRRDAQGWFVELCSGQSLILPASLQSMGLGRAEAERLAAAISDAEARAGTGLTDTLDAFPGTVFIGRQGTAADCRAAGGGN